MFSIVSLAPTLLPRRMTWGKLWESHCCWQWLRKWPHNLLMMTSRMWGDICRENLKMTLSWRRHRNSCSASALGCCHAWMGLWGSYTASLLPAWELSQHQTEQSTKRERTLCLGPPSCWALLTWTQDDKLPSDLIQWTTAFYYLQPVLPNWDKN